MSGKKLTLAMFLLAANLFFLLSCDNSTEPPGENIDLSNYQWTADTLIFEDAFQILMQSIWGSDKNNVYVCGHSSPGIGDLWKYDGQKWSIIPDNLYTDQANARPNVIEGTQHNDIWIGGRYDFSDSKHKPFISHYTGSKWNIHEIPGSREEVLTLHSTGLNKVYAGGDWGAVWYYDGVKWEKDVLEFDVSPGTNCKVRAVKQWDNEIHLLVVATDLLNNNTRYWYISGDMGNWEIKNSMTRNFQNVQWDFAVLGFFELDNLLHTYRPGVFKQTGDKWERVFPELTDNMAISDVETMGGRQFISVGEFSDVHFYNGSTLKVIEQLPDDMVIYRRLEIVDDEVFIIGFMRTPPYSTVIFHGFPQN